MGFSSHHDSEHLNQLAQSGTQVGNFLYIDTASQGYLEELNTAVSDSLGMALASASKPRMTLLNKVTALKENKVCDVIEEYESDDEEIINLEDELNDDMEADEN